MTAQRTKTVYKRMEHDDEFRARLKAVGVDGTAYYNDSALDDFAWEKRRMQRRLVDDFA